MKKEFIGYYSPTEAEINNSWTSGVFSFDANTLLNLYRYTELTRNDFLNALKTLKDKLFLPHQAALEYHNNRIAVIERVANSYTLINEIFKSNFEKYLEPQINQFKKHPAIQIEAILKLHEEFLKNVSAELEKEKKNHPDFMTDDKVLNELTELFENSVGKEFSKQEFKKIFEEGKERYADSIPPGFKDAETKRKKGERHMYGDLIIWKELIEQTKREKKPLVFVTDDRKEDWWTIDDGKTIRPREELIKEFFDITSVRILIYNADNFLHYAKEKNYIPNLNDDTIKEVKEIRVSDERQYLRTALDEKAKIINDIIRNRSYEQKTINNILTNENYLRQINLRGLLDDSWDRQLKIADIIGGNSINPGKSISELMGEDNSNPGKSISELMGENNSNPGKTISELMGENNSNPGKTISELTGENTTKKKTEMDQLKEFKVRPIKEIANTASVKKKNVFKKRFIRNK